MNEPTVRVSRTAEFMALFRALESAKPPHRRIVYDPFARAFLRPSLRAATSIARVPGANAWIENFIDRRWPGARSSGVARTRVIDQWVGEATAQGCRQLAILGAGFDCRSLRLAELHEIPVFELDRPALLEFKQRCLGGDDGRGAPKRVAVDFLNDDIGDRLIAAGFAVGTRTLFLWEGVTNYLDAAAVDATFAIVSRLSGPGSRIIFTYVDDKVLDDVGGDPGWQRTSAVLTRSNERWTFGLRPESLRDYLAARGFALRIDLNATEYRRLCWGAEADRLVGYEFYHAVVADVG